ncbi:hypothetical protein [Streptomyces sparsus]
MMRQVRLAAAVTVVLLALTGFSHADISAKGSKGGKSRSSGSSSGGGCSKKSSSSSSAYKSDDRKSNRSGNKNRYGSGTGGSNSDSADRSPTGRVRKCVTSTRPEATVMVTAKKRSGSHRVSMRFVDVSGRTVDTGSKTVRLRAGQSLSVQVPMNDPDVVDQVDDCVLESVR